MRCLYDLLFDVSGTWPQGIILGILKLLSIPELFQNNEGYLGNKIGTMENDINSPIINK